MTDDDLLDSLSDRITEIESLSWVKIAELAESFGVTKPEGETWKDQAINIAMAEAKATAEKEGADSIETPPSPEVEKPDIQKSDSGVSGYNLIKSFRALKCPVCDLNVRTGLNGETVCPIKDSSCPRNA